MFGSLTYYTNATSVANIYKKNSENFFIASQQKPKKKYTSLTNLLKECPLIGQVKHGDHNFIA